MRAYAVSRKLLTLAGAATGAAVVLTAQSQTVWIATAIVMPLMLFYRLLEASASNIRARPLTSMVLLLMLFGGLAWLLFALMSVDYDTAYTRYLGNAESTEGLSFFERSRVHQEIFDDTLSGRSHIWALARDIAADHPWFGYGLTAWNSDFRSAMKMPFAFHAHNQYFQSLSVAGGVGVATLVLYGLTMWFFAWRTAAASRGLGLLLVTMMTVRGVSESPLAGQLLLSGDAFVHLLTLSLLFCHVSRMHRALRARRHLARASNSPRRRRHRSRSRAADQRSGEAVGVAPPADVAAVTSALN
ncbi:MAG: O-antigen ligase family protein [Burkholderiaceae bacterium]